MTQPSSGFFHHLLLHDILFGTSIFLGKEIYVASRHYLVSHCDLRSVSTRSTIFRLKITSFRHFQNLHKIQKGSNRRCFSTIISSAMINNYLSLSSNGIVVEVIKPYGILVALQIADEWGMWRMYDLLFPHPNSIC